MSSSDNDFSEFTFAFRRLNLDHLFSVSERQCISDWIEKARSLLIDLLRTEHRSIINIWLNIHDGIYDRLDSSMSTAMCLEKLREFPQKCSQPSNELSTIIATIDISVPHPDSLRSPRNRKYCDTGVAERVFDFVQDCGVARIIDRVPTIILNHQMFDVQRPKKGEQWYYLEIILKWNLSFADEDDLIEEPIGVFFVAVVLAHEITHAINLARSIHDPHLGPKSTSKLLVFRSYSGNGEIDGGNLIERIMLDGELHLSKPPPTPPRLFLIVSPAGSQITIPTRVVKECVETRSTKPMNELLNKSYGNSNVLPGLRKILRAEHQPLLIFPALETGMEEKDTSPTMPLLDSSMHAR